MTIFSTAKDEKVVSVERISEPETDEEDELLDATDLPEGGEPPAATEE